jgi:hypothetical protein
MRITAFDHDGSDHQPLNRRPNQLVIAVDGGMDVTMLSDWQRPAAVTSSTTFGLQALDLTVRVIGTAHNLAVGSIQHECAGVHVVSLMQRFHRFVTNGQPIEPSPLIPNTPPQPVPDGVYLVGITANQQRYSAACLATVAIEALPLEIVDHEWADYMPRF